LSRQLSAINIQPFSVRAAPFKKQLHIPRFARDDNPLNSEQFAAAADR